MASTRTLAAPDQAETKQEQVLDRVSAYSLLAPASDELAILTILTILGGLALALQGALMTILNFAIPAAIMYVMARGTITALRLSVATIWTPMIWLRAAIFFYGGFGTLVLLVANDAMRDYAETFFVFYADDILRYNVVICFFTLVVLGAFKLLLYVAAWNRAADDVWKLSPSSVSLDIIGTLFLVAGLVAAFFFIVPYQFGFSDAAFPAAISEVAQASYIGLFLTTVSFARTKPALVWVSVSIGTLLAGLGLMAFSKSSVVMPIVMLLLAYFYLKPSLLRVAVMVLTTMTAFFLSAPIVDHGRALMVARFGGIEAPANPAERLEIVESYFDDRSAAVGDEDVNYATLRFSYVNVGTFVIEMYDVGQRGDTYRNAAAIFIPRAVWADKPIITEVARQLSYEATGNWNNSVAPGLAPEAYWNGGWLGVFLAGMVCAIIVGIWSIYSLSVQFSAAWHLFPVALLGARMGSRFDGFFVSDVMGPIAFAVVGHFLLSFVNAVIARRSTVGAVNG